MSPLIFLGLVFLAFALPPPLAIPAPNLPSGLPLPTSLVGQQVLIVGGTEGIGNATAWEFYNRGASVTITTRDLDIYVESGVEVPFDVLQLEYGRDKSVERLVTKYLRRVGRIPDILIDAGLTTYVGNLLDFNREEMEYAMRMYATDPILLVKEFLQHNDVSKPFTVSFALSTASYGAATSFISLYTAGKQLKKDFIRDFALYDGPKYYPNVRLVGIACANVNTSLNVNGYYPGVAKGDPLAIQLKSVLIASARLGGTHPSVVAKAHLEATTTLTYANSTLFLVPTSASGRYVSEILHAIYVQDNSSQFVVDSRAVYQLQGINITALIGA